MCFNYGIHFFLENFFNKALYFSTNINTFPYKCAALKIFIESVNVELEKAASPNRILNVSPGSIKGTSFNNGKTDLSVTEGLAKDIITHLEAKDDLFIPQYDEIFRNVLERYHDDFREEGRHSYEYKLKSGRI